MLNITRRVLVLISFLVVLALFSGAISAANWNVSAGDSIQTVVDNATANDTITVNDNNGTPYTYAENIIINKNLTIKAREGNNVIIQAASSSNPVFTINSGGSGTTIEGLTIKGASTSGSSGIYLNGATNCTIIANNINNNYIGINAFSDNNTIQDNSITSNSWMGINLSNLNHNVIQNNEIVNNNYGIHMGNCNNITITGNLISGPGNFGINPQVSTATIKFNRIIGFSYFGIVNQASSVVDATNNWWGTNYPVYVNSPNWPTKADVYVEGGTATYNPYLILNADLGSGSSGNLSIIADLIHNNNNADTSSEGHIPDDMPITFTTDKGIILSPVYTHDGYTTTILNYGNLPSTNITVQITADYQIAIMTIMLGSQTSYAMLNITSAAYDNSTDQPLNISYAIPLNLTVNWISVVWGSYGEFQDVVAVVVNGNVVGSKIIYNKPYHDLQGLISEHVLQGIVTTNRVLPATISNNDPKALEWWTRLETPGLCAIYNLTCGFSTNEVDFIKTYRTLFIDMLHVTLSYPGVGGKEIVISDSSNSNSTLDLHFLGNTINRISPIIYCDGDYIHYVTNATIPGQSEPYTGPVVEYAGYEGVQSFAIARTKVTATIVQNWMNACEPLLNTTGAWKAAYGTFLTSLLLEYCHDQVANQAATQFNVTWARTSPIAVATIDDPHNTYLTLECDHGMGMTAVGDVDDVFAFNFACSSAISPLEYWVFQSMFPGTPLNGSVTMGLGDLLLNGTPLDIYMSNGYVVVKSINSTDKILVIDPETGIVRDILLNSTIFGAYCYYDLQTEMVVDLGHIILTTGPEWLGFVSSQVIAMGTSLAYITKNAGGPPNWKRYILSLILAGSGTVGAYYSSNLDKEVNPTNLLNFFLTVVPSLIPVFGTEGGAVGDMTLSYFTQNGFKTTVTSISKNFEGYVITVMPVKLGELFVGGSGIETGFVASVQYVRYGIVESTLRTSYGRTAVEAVRNFVNYNIIPTGISTYVNTYSPEINQYGSQLYNSINEYLSNP